MALPKVANFGRNARIALRYLSISTHRGHSSVLSEMSISRKWQVNRDDTLVMNLWFCSVSWCLATDIIRVAEKALAFILLQFIDI